MEKYAGKKKKKRKNSWRIEYQKYISISKAHDPLYLHALKGDKN